MIARLTTGFAAAALLLTAPAFAQQMRFEINAPLGRHARVRLAYANGPARYRAEPVRSWVPGHYACEQQRIWVPGTCEQIWVAPVYETRYDACGRPYRVLICGAHYETIEKPGHYEQRAVQVWREGHWEVIDICD